MYSRDWELAPITIDSSNQVFRLVEDPAGAATVKTVAVPAGEYYLHNDATWGYGAGTKYQGLFAYIDNNLGVNYAIRATTPTLSSDHTNGGWQIEHQLGTAIEIDFSHVSFTMDPRWFGFLATEGNVSAGDGKLNSKYGIRGNRRGEGIHSDGFASRKRSRTFRDVSQSHERTSDRYVLEWYQEQWREYVMEYIPAVHVFESRASDSAYATTGRLAQYDAHNAWETIHAALARDLEVMICHDVGDSWNLNPNSHSVEAVKLRRVDQMRDVFACVELMATAGELYRLNVDFTVVADSGLGGYNH